MARDDAAISASDLASKPLDVLKAKVGEIVIVRGIGCVDPGSSGFLCVAKVGTKSVRLDANVLGSSTSVPIAERLIGRCKGLPALTRPECRVDALVTPTSVDRSVDGETTTVFATEIDMYAPRKK